MKKLLFVFSMLLIIYKSSAQKIRFTDTSNTWVFSCWDDPASPLTNNFKETYSYGGDSIIGGNVYRSLRGKWVREDTALNKVYILHNGNEEILMDYNLKLNDTLRTNGHECVVIFFDSLLINNAWHYKQVLKKLANYVPFTIIEGIGCMFNGPFYPLNPEAIEPICSFCSIEHNGALVFSNPGACALKVNDQLHTSRGLTIVPNPVKNNSRISWACEISRGKLSITDVSGRIVLTKTFTHKQELQIENTFVPGIYFLQINDLDKNKTFNGKFVSQ